MKIAATKMMLITGKRLTATAARYDCLPVHEPRGGNRKRVSGMKLHTP